MIEDTGAGSSLIQELRRDSQLSIIEITPKDDKATRMMAASPSIEGGRVFIPREAHWLAEFQREMVMFPKGKHDDQVDSVSQFLNCARDHRTPNNFAIFAVPSLLSRMGGYPDPWDF